MPFTGPGRLDLDATWTRAGAAIYVAGEIADGIGGEGASSVSQDEADLGELCYEGLDFKSDLKGDREAVKWDECRCWGASIRTCQERPAQDSYVFSEAPQLLHWE